MLGFNGGLIGKTRATLVSASVPGIWTANEQLEAKRKIAWPTTASNDPFFDKVSLLLTGSSVILDSSSFSNSIVTSGNTSISTAQSKYYGSSIYFDGSGDFLSFSSSSAMFFGTSDFVVEGWFFPVSTGALQVIFDCRGTSASAPWQLYINTNRTISFNTGGGVLTSQQLINYSQWSHIAVSRSTGLIRLFVNGNLDGSTLSNPGSINPAFSTMYIGRVHDSASLFYYGYINDLRVTKDANRSYTANFSPPAAAV